MELQRCLGTKRNLQNFYLNENEYKWHEQFPILFNPSILFPRWTNRFHRSRSIINSCSSRTRSKERASVYLAAEGRKRKAISLIAAVKEREKRGNGTKTLHNRCQRPIKEHRLRPFQLSSLPAIFFISWNSNKDMDLVSRETTEALEKNKRVGREERVHDEWHGEWNTPEHGLCFQIICIIVYCGGATQSWRRNNRRTSVYV